MRNIYAHSEERFGRLQVEGYHSGLERTFELLADFPGIGVNCDYIRSGLRRFRFQSHYVFDADTTDHILVVGIFHTKQTIRPELFE